ncbi:MAG: hypothetical protein R6U70_07045 [Bacillota bacterium]
MNRYLLSFVARFTLLYAIIYWVAGMVCYQVFNYDEALTTMEYFDLYRPMESFLMVGVVFFGSIIRGAILALLLHPFFAVIRLRKNSWLLLFAVLFGLTALCSLTFISTAVEDLAGATSLGEALADLQYGTAEIVIQMLLFSWLFTWWERRRERKASVTER